MKMACGLYNHRSKRARVQGGRLVFSSQGRFWKSSINTPNVLSCLRMLTAFFRAGFDCRKGSSVSGCVHACACACAQIQAWRFSGGPSRGSRCILARTSLLYLGPVRPCRARQGLHYDPAGGCIHRSQRDDTIRLLQCAPVHCVRGHALVCIPRVRDYSCHVKAKAPGSQRVQPETARHDCSLHGRHLHRIGVRCVPHGTMLHKLGPLLGGDGGSGCFLGRLVLLCAPVCAREQVGLQVLSQDPPPQQAL